MLRLALLAAAAASVSATAPGVRASISSHALKYIVVRRRRNCVAVSGRSPTPLLAAPAPAPATPPPRPARPPVPRTPAGHRAPRRPEEVLHDLHPERELAGLLNRQLELSSLPKAAGCALRPLARPPGGLGDARALLLAAQRDVRDALRSRGIRQRAGGRAEQPGRQSEVPSNAALIASWLAPALWSRLPSRRSQEDSKHGKVKVSISNGVCHLNSLGSGSLSPVPGQGIAGSIQGISVDCSAHIKAKLSIWPHPSCSFDVRGSVNGASAGLVIGVAETGGKPVLSSKSVSVNVGSFKLSFHGGETAASAPSDRARHAAEPRRAPPRKPEAHRLSCHLPLAAPAPAPAPCW